jgi:dihydroorotase
LLTLNPAQILHLPVGRLAVDEPADLVLFDPDFYWQICPDDFLAKSKNAPFDDRPVRGRVQLTMVDGRTIFRRAG